MRILLVEDDTILADALCRALVQCAYAVDVVAHGEQADNALAIESYDLAILDIGLPGMSGYELAALIKAPPVGYCGRLLALSGYGQAADVAASGEAGFDAHLTKPVAAPELLEQVDKLFRSTCSTPRPSLSA
jgi:two-component system, OmpR family, response regulator